MSANGTIEVGTTRPQAKPGMIRGFFRNRGALRVVIGGALLLCVVIPALVSLWFTPFDPNVGTLTARMRPPMSTVGSATYLLGTDQLGRDILSRMMAGGRVSLMVAGLAVLFSGAIGSVLGLIAGYSSRWFDQAVTMLGEIQLSLPSILIVVLFLAIIGPSIVTVAIVLAISDWVVYSRMVRGRTLVEKAKDYVLAARALGAADRRVLFRHLFPNVLPTLMVVAAVQLGTMIMLESALSYLGLGVLRPNPTWGRMVSDGQPYLRDAWWVSMIPGLTIGFVVLGINLLGDGLRELWKME